jgi:glutamine synthetase
MLTDIYEQIEKGAAKVHEAWWHARHRRDGPPQAATGCRRSQSYESLRLHGQQVRVPRCLIEQSIAYPNIALNLAVTESLDYMATELEKATKGSKSIERAVLELLPKVIKENKRIIFNGNNYSAEWEKEARKRGLLNLKNTVDALPELVSKDVVAAFEKYKVLSKRELHARYEIMLETYNKTVNVEGQLMLLMANRHILPAALEYQKQVAQSVSAVKAAGTVRRGQEGAPPHYRPDGRVPAAYRQAPACARS